MFPNMTQPDYDAWNELLHLDPPRKEIIAAVSLLSVSYDIYIFTAKPIKYKKDVQRWLLEHAPFNYVDIFMRPDGCMKTSPDLKRYFIRKLLFGDDRITLAIDDRQDICDMYNQQNITTFKV